MFIECQAQPEYFFPLFADKLFCDLSPESLKSLNKIKETKQFRKGFRFFSGEEMPHCIYILREGKVQLLLNDKSKDLQLARLIEPNEIFGLTEIIADLPYEMNAETITLCTCECFEREDFIRFLFSEPEVCFRLVKLLSLNLQKSYELLFSSIN
jgi:CRP-like cAMP-binding protein